tara:strand:- start:1568 stop:1936 length:369 start_codon:yes stop_codon:yes gene_type:complete
MTYVLELAKFFNYIGGIEEGQTLFIRKEKYVSKHNIKYKLLRKLYRETVNRQIDIIERKMNTFRYYMKSNNKMIYLTNIILASLNNMYQGLTRLSQTYGKPENLEIFLGNIDRTIKNYNITN